MSKVKITITITQENQDEITFEVDGFKQEIGITNILNSDKTATTALKPNGQFMFTAWRGCDSPEKFQSITDEVE
jgi:hypothetical protein